MSEPEVVRKYLDNQKIAIESHRVAQAASEQMAAILRRARDIVVAGRGITGKPEYGTPIASGGKLRHRKKWGWVFEIKVQHYRGEGIYETDEWPIIFPARWLEMSAKEWQAELRECVVRRDARNAERLRTSEEAKARAQEEAERATLARLAAKYGTTPGGTP